MSDFKFAFNKIIKFGIEEFRDGYQIYNNKIIKFVWIEGFGNEFQIFIPQFLVIFAVIETDFRLISNFFFCFSSICQKDG